MSLSPTHTEPAHHEAPTQDGVERARRDRRDRGSSEADDHDHSRDRDRDRGHSRNREHDDDDEPPAKRRRPRPQLSCTGASAGWRELIAECRRLKMKCDRKIPCGNCTRRELAATCRRGGPKPAGPDPNGAAESTESGASARLAYLEDLLVKNGISVPSGSVTPLAAPAPTQAPQGLSTLDPAALHTSAAPNITHTAPPPAPRTPLHAPTPALSPDILSARLFGLRSTSSDGMPTLAAAADMVDDRQAQPDLASLREVHSLSQGQAQGHGQEGLADMLDDAGDDEADDEGIGTLVMFPSGRARFLGRTAGSEWLKNQESAAGPESPSPESRAPSPVPATWPPHGHLPGLDIKPAFPFNTAAKSFSSATLLAQLPPESDGRTLVAAYFRHFDWHFSIVTKDKVNSIFDRAYRLTDGPKPYGDELALLFIVFAFGAYYNLELPPDDSSVQEYLHVSRCCLAKADFLSRNTLAVVQTLFLMFHLHLSLESGGDSGWPLLGLVMRMLQAMGLHRDGKRWGLSDELIEERRFVFWECYFSDMLASNNFCRPGSILPEFMDTAYPDLPPDPGHHALWKRAQFELTNVFVDTLNHNMRLPPPPYSNVAAVHDRITAFELNVPFVLRCRPVLVALPSLYADPETAIAASPPTNKRNLQLTFQQFILALNISEGLMHLHRPYFARALYESPKDPSRSRFGQSYLAVVERCNVIVTIASSLFSMYPQTAARHWYIWFHAFCSAACMGTLVLKNPHNVLAGFALGLVDSVIKMYASAAKSRNSDRMAKNLSYLVSMRARLDARLAHVGQTPDGNPAAEDEGDDDLELLGWKTRLIERAEAGLMRARTINPSPRDLVSPSTVVSAAPPPAEADIGGDILLDQFWDSIAGQDGSLTIGDIGSINWWAHGGLGEYGIE